eukprot:Nk52_evm2s244 gene=Nk52_evmTU2s244
MGKGRRDGMGKEEDKGEAGQGQQHLEALESASESARYNIILQIVFRVLTFAVNAFTIRLVSGDVLGVVNVRLALLYTTILFLAREPTRRTCTSSSGVGKDRKEAERDGEWGRVNNLVWTSVFPQGAVWLVLMCWVWLNRLDEDTTRLHAGYGRAVVLYAGAAMLELVGESGYVRAVRELQVHVKVVVEGVAMVVKCFVTIVPLLVLPPERMDPLLVFAFAQVCFSLTILLGYSVFLWRHDHVILHIPSLPTSLVLADWTDPRLFWLTAGFVTQTFLKQILTEGERIVMTVFHVISFAEQGAFDVINNLGSLVVRFLFLPLEESYYVFFARVLPRDRQEQTAKDTNVPLAFLTFSSLLKFVSFVGILILSFGPNYASCALHLYGGEKLSTMGAPYILQWYCVYVFIIAINGTTEALVFAAADNGYISYFNRIMVVFSAVFLAASYYLTRVFGSVGFIMANCINMLIRIVHSLAFIHRYHSRQSSERGSNTIPHPIVASLPHPMVLATLLISFLVTRVSMLYCLPGMMLGGSSSDQDAMSSPLRDSLDELHALYGGGDFVDAAYDVLVQRRFLLTAFIVHIGMGVVMLGLLAAVVVMVDRVFVREAIGCVLSRRGRGPLVANEEESDVKEEAKLPVDAPGARRRGLRKSTTTD